MTSFGPPCTYLRLRKWNWTKSVPRPSISPGPPQFLSVSKNLKKTNLRTTKIRISSDLPGNFPRNIDNQFLWTKTKWNEPNSLTTERFERIWRTSKFPCDSFGKRRQQIRPIDQQSQFCSIPIENIESAVSMRKIHYQMEKVHSGIHKKLDNVCNSIHCTKFKHQSVCIEFFLCTQVCNYIQYIYIECVFTFQALRFWRRPQQIPAAAA